MPVGAETHAIEDHALQRVRERLAGDLVMDVFGRARAILDQRVGEGQREELDIGIAVLQALLDRRDDIAGAVRM